MKEPPQSAARRRSAPISFGLKDALGCEIEEAAMTTAIGSL
jgi:hypothetical protein